MSKDTCVEHGYIPFPIIHPFTYKAFCPHCNKPLIEWENEQ